MPKNRVQKRGRQFFEELNAANQLLTTFYTAYEKLASTFRKRMGGAPDAHEAIEAWYQEVQKQVKNCVAGDSKAVADMNKIRKQIGLLSDGILRSAEQMGNTLLNESFGKLEELYKNYCEKKDDFVSKIGKFYEVRKEYFSNQAYQAWTLALQRNARQYNQIVKAVKEHNKGGSTKHSDVGNLLKQVDGFRAELSDSIAKMDHDIRMIEQKNNVCLRFDSTYNSTLAQENEKLRRNVEKLDKAYWTFYSTYRTLSNSVHRCGSVEKTRWAKWENNASIMFGQFEDVQNEIRPYCECNDIRKIPNIVALNKRICSLRKQIRYAVEQMNSDIDILKNKPTESWFAMQIETGTSNLTTEVSNLTTDVSNLSLNPSRNGTTGRQNLIFQLFTQPVGDDQQKNGMKPQM